MSAQPTLRVTVVDAFATAREQFEELPEFLRTEEALGMTHSDMERALETRGRELMRSLYQGWLDQQAPAQTEAPVVDAEGEERTDKRRHDRALETTFGTVRVERTGYGAEGKASLHPFDGQLNLPDERYSHQVRRRVAEEASKSSFDETVDTVARYTGAHIPKRQVEELAGRAAQDFDEFYQTRRQAAAAVREGTGSVLVITSDGKGVVLHQQDLRPATRKAAQRRRQKLGTRLSKGEKRHRKRMATVTAVYTVAPYVRTPDQVFRALARRPPDQEREPRPRPESKRVTASLEQEPEQVLAEAFQEALDRDPNRDKTWVSVVDGNKPQLAILEKLAKKHGIELTIVLDIIHVLEYVWKAGRAFEAESSDELEQWALQRLERILQGRASHVAAGMRRAATKRKLSKKKREPVDCCADYLLKYKQYLAYDRYLAAGLPIGSGVVEGTARHLVKDRMALTGARWRLTGAEAVLRLRALRSSQDFDEYWHFHEAREHERNHRSRYANEQVPTTNRPPGTTRPTTPHLRVVKTE
jgi:hypothetical protein